MTFPAATVPLFVYGSLRPGMALWDAIADHVAEVRAASVAGRLHWHEGGEWPLLLLGGTERVRGDLLALRPGDAANRVIVDEELRYGYDARWLPVTTDDGEQLEALVLVWPRETELGPQIADGDFAVAVVTPREE
ncbi:gamma-glutamylcyclotransferase [Microbacterium sp. SSM24]|uniref:gamma-glutamylcyclotransferase family protein n=1 Tax=Microbacterium sp. SSM24 TaxID=2991714 RepID=UPI0022261102|nr:gamma-glutamylcyclotransferase family protein [Microbacterium sp. SSM24]MCW3492131.1 gamma-glutamylcyclotransferase [Microbacterium sp. SSM24]